MMDHINLKDVLSKYNSVYNVYKDSHCDNVFPIKQECSNIGPPDLKNKTFKNNIKLVFHSHPIIYSSETKAPKNTRRKSEKKAKE